MPSGLLGLARAGLSSVQPGADEHQRPQGSSLNVGARYGLVMSPCGTNINGMVVVDQLFILLPWPQSPSQSVMNYLVRNIEKLFYSLFVFNLFN